MVPLCVIFVAAEVWLICKCLIQIRKRKKNAQDDMFCEILQASAASDCDQRTWTVTIALSCNLEKKRADMRKAQESQQEKESEMHQGIMGLFQT
ncbi:unnamed protein product [Caretta caretta]